MPQEHTIERAVLVGLNADCFSKEETASEASLEELEALLETAGGLCTAKILQNRHTPDARTLIGAGKAEEIRQLIQATEAGMAIFDTMQYVKCDVATICVGMAASMGAFLLASGTKGKRLALPNAEIMIHQPLLSGLQGQTTDIKIHADHMVRTRERMNRMLSEYTGQPIEKIMADTERDNFMSAQEAADYGLIDAVITKR